MEGSGIKQRLELAQINSEKIKIIFQYPRLSKQTIRIGKVEKCFDDCFNFKDRFDGNMTFSYDFIIEICTPKEDIQ